MAASRATRARCCAASAGPPLCAGKGLPKRDVLRRSGSISARLPWFIRRPGGMVLRAFKRARFVWSREPDNHPDVIAAQALAHAARTEAPVTLAFAYHVPAEKIDAYLGDGRVAGVVTKDAQHVSELPERLLDDPRVGRRLRTHTERTTKLAHEYVVLSDDYAQGLRPAVTLLPHACGTGDLPRARRGDRAGGRSRARPWG